MRWSVAIAISAALLLGGCSRDRPEAAASRPMAQAPHHVVSLDLCADQYVLRFVPRDRIAGVSPDAAKKFSYMRDRAVGVPIIRPTAEDVLAARPDLIVRAYGGGPNAAAFFSRAGIPVVDLGWANSFGDIATNTRRIAEELGAKREGEKVAADMERRLQTAAEGNDRTVLYMTPGGVTTGPGSLIHQAIEAAGYRNFQTRPGWNPIPLERLARVQPDIVAASFFEEFGTHPARWSAMRHPIAQRQLKERPVVRLDGAWTACGGWFNVYAVEALAEGKGQ
ncbi:MAG: ABC transporter substrate-binding protein [Parvularcula sp.]